MILDLALTINGPISPGTCLMATKRIPPHRKQKRANQNNDLSVMDQSLSTPGQNLTSDDEVSSATEEEVDPEEPRLVYVF